MLDWVVQNESWRYQATTIRYGEYLMIPLAIPDFRIGGVLQENYRLPENFNGATVEAVLGSLTYHLYPANGDLVADVFNLTFMSVLMARIVVYPIDPELPEAAVAMNPTYDTRRPATANERFLWQGEKVIASVASNVWAGTPALLTPWYGQLRVRTQAKRRLGPLDGLWLYVQWGRLATGIGNGFQDLDDLSNPDNAVNIILTPRMRTLLRLPR